MAARKKSGANAAANYPPWSQARLNPVVLLLGSQDLFARRAVTDLKRQVIEGAAGDMEPPDIVEISAGAEEEVPLAQYLSPSLFGGKPVVILENLQAAGDSLQRQLLSYLENPSPDAILIMIHSGENGGKKVLDVCKKGAASIYSCAPLSNRRDKIRFLNTEAGRYRRGISTHAAEALADALGQEFEEMVAVADQLFETAGDLSKPLSDKDVDVYLQGRLEVTGFNVADAAVAGRVGEALTLLRHALATGVVPVQIVSAMALKVRQMLQVIAPPGREVKESGWLGRVNSPPDWVVRNLRQTLRFWDEERLGRALQAVALTDEQVKGASRDPEYALEAMILEVSRCATGASQTAVRRATPSRG